MRDFLTALGLVLIVEGLPYFVVPGRMRRWMMQVIAVPDTVLRPMGLVFMIIGLFVIYLVRG